MKRQKRNKKGASQKSDSGSSPIVNHYAAGIDIGSEEHWVAVPEDRDEHPVRSFGCFTSDLHTMARWLTACGITTVAMESTGVYWTPSLPDPRRARLRGKARECASREERARTQE